MNVLLYQQSAASIFQTTLGKKPALKDVEYFAKKLMDGMSTSELAAWLIRSPDGQRHYGEMSKEQQVSFVYSNLYQQPPSSSEVTSLVNQLNSGKTLGNVAAGLSDALLNYQGQDETMLQQQTILDDSIMQALYPGVADTPAAHSGAQDVLALFYAVGAIATADGVTYWGNVIGSGTNTFANVAQKFIDTRPAKFAALNDSEFINKIYVQLFTHAPNEVAVNHYLGAMAEQQLSRGAVLSMMIDDLRTSTAESDSAAQQKLAKVEHVYGPGEMPTAEHQETVAALYLSIAGRGVDASGLEAWSKFLASGASEYDLLKILAKSGEFSGAEDYVKLYYTLHGNQRPLSEMESQAILLRAGNDKLQASLVVLEAFRTGESLIGSNNPVSVSKIFEFNHALATSLGYKTIPQLDVSQDGGNPSGDVNGYGYHKVTDSELTLFTSLVLQVNHAASVDLSHAMDLDGVTLTGDLAANPTTVASLVNQDKSLSLQLNNAALNAAAGTLQLGVENDNVLFTGDADLSQANLKIYLDDGINTLRWQGNSVNGGANNVSENFYASGKEFTAESAYSIMDANFITKTIQLTTQPDGSITGAVSHNLKNFSNFQYVELSGYTGTGEIYLDGQRVGNDGAKVFDRGLYVNMATINNPDHDDVASLTQDRINYVNAQFPAMLLTAKPDQVRVINVPLEDQLVIANNLGSDSHLQLETAHYPRINNDQKALTVSIMRDLDVGSGAAPNKGQYIDAGTLGLTSHFGEQPAGALSIFVQSVNTSLTLSGGNNHLTDVTVDGIGLYSSNYEVNLHIKADFSDSLQHVGAMQDDMLPYTQMQYNLTLDVGGTGGGDFYQNLLSLQDNARFSELLDGLSGYQLRVTGGNADDSFKVIGNTTVSGGSGSGVDITTFEHSSVDSMVKVIDVLSPLDRIVAGEAGHQWSFSSRAEKQMAVYGDYTSSSKLNALFDSIDGAANGSAQALFSSVLSAATAGASDGQLAEVGALKLGNALYVIVDNNANQSFDDRDMVFSLGDRDIYQTALQLHYDSPEVALSGIAAAQHETFA